MSVITTNTSSLIAQNALQSNQTKLQTSMQRLSTGMRINSSKDDAAGLAISSRMESQIRGIDMAVRNANDGISLMQTTEGALQEVTSMLQRMRELAVQSVNAINNDSDRASLDAEVQQLKSEIDRIATTTQFNSQNVLDGSFKNKAFQIGDQPGSNIALSIASVKTQDLGLGGANNVSNTLASSRINLSAAIQAGDIKINGQDVGAIGASDDMEDIVKAINDNVDNVKASGFNIVQAKNVGTGVTDGTSATGFKITVTELGQSTATAFVISASNSMEELVANINAEVGGVVNARLNDSGKLELSNETGASITVTNGINAGFSADTATVFKGFLKLQSTDGSPVRIERGNMGLTAPGTTADLEALGFREVTKESLNDAYTTTGIALTSAGVSGAWGRTDIKINGVQIYDENITTTSFQGKLDTINSLSAKTGVTASAFLEKVIDTRATFNGTDGTEFDSTDVISINGEQVALGADISALVTNINAVTAKTGIKAEAVGSNLILSGNVQALTIDSADTTGIADQVGTNTYLGLADVALGGETASYAAIRLDSTNNRPISIELGDGATVAEHGLLETNVGAADYEVNAATMGGASGQAVAGVNIASQGSANEAISSIDGALQAVSAMRADMGAVQNRLEHTITNLNNISTNTAASRSRIQDTDYAKETSALAKAQIIQQAATAMLAQANQSGQNVLALLK